MRPALIVAGIVSLLFAGCAGHSFDCVIGEARSDCAPGTPGGEKRVQQEQEARTFSAIDDARCRSLANEFARLLCMPPQDGRNAQIVLIAWPIESTTTI